MGQAEGMGQDLFGARFAAYEASLAQGECLYLWCF